MRRPARHFGERHVGGQVAALAGIKTAGGLLKLATGDQAAQRLTRNADGGKIACAQKRRLGEQRQRLDGLCIAFGGSGL